jgi:hypothetical protein
MVFLLCYFVQMGDTGEAVKIYSQQVTVARQADNQDLLATAMGALGHAHRLLGQHDRALACHNQVGCYQFIIESKQCMQPCDCMHRIFCFMSLLVVFMYSADRLTRNCRDRDRAFELSVFHVIRNRIP